MHKTLQGRGKCLQEHFFEGGTCVHPKGAPMFIRRGRQLVQAWFLQ